MSKVRWIGVLIAFLVITSVAFGQTSSSQASAASSTSKTKVVKETGKSRGAGATNPNIKNADTKNNAKEPAPAPANKGGKTRGAGPYKCGIHVDNHTAWHIDIYEDGVYAGTVNSWGDVYGITGNGATVLYGVAHFSNAADLEWGPSVFDCPAGSIYTWQLTQP